MDLSNLRDVHRDPRPMICCSYCNMQKELNELLTRPNFPSVLALNYFRLNEDEDL